MINFFRGHILSAPWSPNAPPTTHTFFLGWSQWELCSVFCVCLCQRRSTQTLFGMSELIGVGVKQSFPLIYFSSYFLAAAVPFSNQTSRGLFHSKKWRLVWLLVCVNACVCNLSKSGERNDKTQQVYPFQLVDFSKLSPLKQFKTLNVFPLSKSMRLIKTWLSEAALAQH